ncbi:RNA polymerase sigma factor [Chitinophaga caseinilytica]|uniref:RNA polymerase sigma factor n=1 Tax=Chitinophaga caseinilytica TaxID=2267521 RepID=UPI003C306B74
MDESRFLEELTKHEAILHKICRLYRNTPQDREDLFQEMVYQLWRASPKFEGRSGFGTWMYKVALGTALVHFRERRPEVEFREILPEVAENQDEDRLAEMLAVLTPAEKALMVLYLEGLNYAEMAGIMGISESNAGARLSRARQKIRQHFNPDTWKKH